MSTIPILAKTLQELWGQVQQLALELQSGIHIDWPSLTARLEFLDESSLIEAMDRLIPGWRKIAIIKNGVTAKHTILVLATCMNLSEYKQAAPQTQREIEWAAILHDLDKDISGGKDPAHPFRSAAVAAKAMLKLGFDVQPNIGLNDFEDWATLMTSSLHEINGLMVHDHAHLAEIVAGIHSCWGKNTSASRILKAVLFHQSLPTLKDWTNPVLLSDDELRMSLSLSDMEVLGPILIADSDSWNIFDEPRLAYLDELRENISETRRRINNR